MTDRLTNIPISEARRLAKKHAATRLIVISINERGDYAYTTYGQTKAMCQAVATWSDLRVPDIAREISEQ